MSEINVNDDLRTKGEAILEELYAALSELKKAKRWGIFDIFGGGFFTSYIKQSRMDEARAHMRQAKSDLEIFGRAVKASSKINVDNIKTTDGGGFSDLCGDNIWTDCYVQEKIEFAIEQVCETIEQLKGILNSH